MQPRPARTFVYSNILVFTAALVTAAEPPQPLADKAPRPLKVLYVGGGCCHDYAAQKGLIKKGLEERAYVEVTVVHEGGSATDSKIPLYESKDWSAGYDVVIHHECFASVSDKGWVDNILRPHREGLPAVVVHCGMHSYRTGGDEWFEFCGVTSRRHGKHYAHEVLNHDATHPVMKEFGAGWANPAGELYWIEKLWPNAQPLGTAKNREKGNDEVCIWTNRYHNTRVFGTTLGHHNETVGDPKFLDTLARGTLWAVDKLDAGYLKPAQAKQVHVNIAPGRPTSASSEETGKNNFAPNAADGDPKTRWCANGPGVPQWWQIDLGQPQPITGVRLDWENRAGSYKYTLEGSSDGQAWQMLVDERANQDIDTEHNFQAAAVRHLKLTVTGTPGGGWASLWEVEVFGTETKILLPKESKTANEAKRLGEVKAPPEFAVTLFAEPPAVNYPVYVAAAADGVLYVSSDKNGSLGRDPHHGSVLRVRDLDGDGRADEVKRFVADIDSPRGLVWDHDRLYLMHPPHLSAFIDDNGDGIADRQDILVKNIAFDLKDRPADHTSNGVTLGIDGWLYLAIGDFGFMEAEGKDGRKLQLRGGGVVRVRPDGTGLELYSRGTRNILEVALDPLLNGYTRDNTNDGGGWDIRLHHFTGLENHGYPSQYKNFTDEAVAPLADYGGGSGCGALFLDEPGFPAGYAPAAYTADWGRDWIYRHTLQPKGATVTADQHEFLRLPRVTDLDVDALGNVYASSWKGATFNYNGEDVGYVVRVTPKGYQPEPLPDYAKLTAAELVVQHRSPSHRRRLEAQRALLRVGVDEPTATALADLAGDSSQPLPVRVAALFTLKQGLGEKSHPRLRKLASADSLAAFAIRALTDRWDQLAEVPAESLRAGLTSADPRTRLEAVVALGRLGAAEQAGALAAILGDADPVLAHTVIESLVRLRGADACLTVVDSRSASPAARRDAFRVLQRLHEDTVVHALVTRLEKEAEPARREGLLAALCRLHFREGEWKGNSWGTRPDTSGPYYQPEPWAATERIAAVLTAHLSKAQGAEAAFLAATMAKHKIRAGGIVETLVRAAEQDGTLVPLAVQQLAAGERVPESALALLAKAATDADPPVQAQAVAALVRLNTPEAFRTALQTTARLQERNKNSDWAKQAVAAVLKPAVLEPHAATLVQTFQQSADTWGDAAVLLLATDPGVAKEPQALAQAAVADAWAIPARRVPLLQAALAGNIRRFEPRIIDGLVDADPAIVAAAKKLVDEWKLKLTLPTGPKLSTRKPEAAVAEVAALAGDARAGEQVYIKLNCGKCHAVDQQQRQIGPNLANAARIYKRDQLVEAVLLPSKSIAQGFATNLFLLDDGSVKTGVVIEESAEQVLILDQDGKQVPIPVAAIEARQKQEISTMPNGLANDLTTSQLADLVSYLQSLGGSK